MNSAKGNHKQCVLNGITADRGIGLHISEENQFTVVYENETQKKAILKTLGVPVWESFVNGRVIAGTLGV